MASPGRLAAQSRHLRKPADAMFDASTFREVVSGQRRGIWPGAVRAGLAAVEIPYRLAVGWRNRRYDRGSAEIHRAGVPVISIGNLTLGGTGKRRWSAGPRDGSRSKVGGWPSSAGDMARPGDAQTMRRWSWHARCQVCPTYRIRTALPPLKRPSAGAAAK